MQRAQDNDDGLIQILALGRSPQAWLWNAMVLRRCSEVLFRVATNGDERHTKLAFRDPPPAPGEIRERSATPDEVSALVDSHARAVSLMLLAASVECLLKARLARRGVELIAAEGVLHQKFRTHDLRRLAIQAGAALTDAQLNILDGLRAFIEWRGRYPIPKTWERIRELAGLQLGSIGRFHANAFALADELEREFDGNERVAP